MKTLLLLLATVELILSVEIIRRTSRHKPVPRWLYAAMIGTSLTMAPTALVFATQ
jgi:hypothetical protein